MAEDGDVLKGVKIGWSPLPEGSATSYVILGTRQGQPRHAVTGRLDAAQTEHFIPASRLVKGATYTFQVAGLNGHIHGALSAPSGPVEVPNDDSYGAPWQNGGPHTPGNVNEKPAMAPKPGTPSGCAAHTNPDGSIQVKWQALPVGTATSYVVLMSRNGGNFLAATMRLPQGTTTHRIQADKLVPGSRYHFKVAAINGNTHGVPSAPSEVVVAGSPTGLSETKDGGKPMPPNDVRAVVNKDGSVLVSWTPRRPNHVPPLVPVTSYVILATERGKPRRAVTGRLQGAETNRFMLKHDVLHPNSWYTFQVAPLSGDVHGKPSQPSPAVLIGGNPAPSRQAQPVSKAAEDNVQGGYELNASPNTPSVPGATPPRVKNCNAVVAKDGSLNVMWDPLPTGTATSYVVLATQKGGKRVAVTERLPIAPTHRIVNPERLVPGATYNFQVAAINVHTHGPPCHASDAVVVPAVAPLRPTECNAVAAADGSVTVSWDPLLPGTVTSYVILAKQEGLKRHAVSQRLPLTPTHYKIPAGTLVAGASYTFQVAPINVHTHGPPSPESSAVTVAIPGQVAKGAQPGASTWGPASLMPSLRLGARTTVSRRALEAHGSASDNGAPAPGRVTNAHAVVGSDGTVNVMWDPLPQGSATSYVILATPLGGKRVAVTERLPIAPTHRIINAERVQAGVTYHFQVAAVNVNTHGPPSLPSAPVVIPAVAPLRPTDISAVPEVDGSVTVSWDPLQSGTVTSYVVLATQAGHKRHAVSQRLPLTPTHYKIPAGTLVAGASYTFQVAPINVHTHGPPSPESSAVTVAIPGQVAKAAPQEKQAPKPGRPTGAHAVVGADGSINVMWDPLPVGTVTSYVILATPQGGTRGAVTERLPIAPTHFTVNPERLKAGVSYSFQVAPINVHTHGPPSHPSPSITVPAVAPLRPTECNAVAAADGSVTVSWDPLLPGTVTSYVILAKQEGHNRKAVTRRLPLTPTHYKIPAGTLVAGASYTFQVAPINVHTHGPPSPESNRVEVQGHAVTPPPPVQPEHASPPGRPTGAHAVVGADGSVTVMWDALPVGTVTSYVILATPQGGKRRAVTERLPLAPTHFTVNPERLKAGVSYSFQVAPINIHTHGPPSEPSEPVLVPASEPLRPTECNAVAAADGSVTVSWDPLLPGTVTSYVILAKQEGHNRKAVTRRLPLTPTHYKIPAGTLVAGASYTFQVAPINVHTHGPPSPESSAVTVAIPGQVAKAAPQEKQAPKPGRPTGAHAVVGADGSINVMWDPLPVGTVTSYVILATPQGGTRGAVTERLPIAPTHFIINPERLIPGETYSFQVAPINVHTHGPPSHPSPSITVPAAAPLRPTDISAVPKDDGSVTVSWDPLQPGTVTSYVVLATQAGHKRHAVTGRLPLTPTHYTIPAGTLVAGASYTFQVAPINVHTHGPPSPQSAPLVVGHRGGVNPPATPSHPWNPPLEKPVVPAPSRPWEQPRAPPGNNANNGFPAPPAPREDAQERAEDHQDAISSDAFIARPVLTGAILQPDSRVMVSWDPVQDATNYVVLCEAKGKAREACTGRLPPDQTQAYIERHRLQHGQPYQFQVAAMVGEAKGPPSLRSTPVTVVHTVDRAAPPAPQGVKRVLIGDPPTGAWLSWRDVPGATYYKVHFKQVHTSAWHPFPGGEKVTATSIALKGIKDNLPLLFSVTACNAAGCSIATSLRKPVVVGGLPPLESVTLRVHSDGELGARLLWGHGKLPGHEAFASHVLPTDRYQVTVTEAGKPETAKRYELASHEPEVVIDHLKPHTTYHFMVQAGNPAGFGPPSVTRSLTTGMARAARTDLYILLWVAVEIILVIIICSLIACVYRKKACFGHVGPRDDYERVSLDDIYRPDDSEYGLEDRLYDMEEGRARDGLYEPGNPHELPPQMSVQSVLGDPERQEGFREACEARGYQAYFHAVQDMVDFARCGEAERPMRARDLVKRHFSPDALQRVDVHPETLVAIQDALGQPLAEPEPGLFTRAKEEATAALEMFVLPGYLERHHGVVASPPEGFAALPESLLSQPATVSGVNRMLLTRLSGAHPAMKEELRLTCEELGGLAPLEFCVAVEDFRKLPSGQLPAAAHRIVEEHMASDARLRVNLSNRIQQELISVARPHSGMFDNAQKEALYILTQLLCPGAPVPKPRGRGAAGGVQLAWASNPKTPTPIKKAR